jgi:malate dehydrogenase (oxaloacetate-decarboxylating)
MGSDEEALAYHRTKHGKIAVRSKTDLDDVDDLNKAYTPGVAAPVREIQKDRNAVYEYTSKGEMVGIMSDGSSVLGMGQTGPEAAIPVMEGKALLLRELADLSGLPLVVDTDETTDLIEEGERLHPMVGFMILEDIASPACFTVEEELKERLDIPVMHDDQHGIAIATLAALHNALAVVEKDIEDIAVTVVGAGAAGIATTELLREAGVDEMTVVDRQGIIAPGMDGLTWAQEELACSINPDGDRGSLKQAMEGSDVVIGLSVGGIISQEMVEGMAEDPIVFALANPDPEIMPADAEEAGASVVATGRSDFPNQINNALVFPGVVKGCLDCYASGITTEMKLAAAEALAGMVDPDGDKILPAVLDRDVVSTIAAAVEESGREEGVCRR